MGYRDTAARPFVSLTLLSGLLLTASGVTKADPELLPSTDVVVVNEGSTAFLTGRFAGLDPAGVVLEASVGRIEIVQPLPGDVYFVRAGEDIGPAHAIAAGDFDGDGDIDLVTADDQSRIWLNRGDGTFGLSQTAFIPARADVEVGDLDGDGDLDIILLHDRGDCRVLRNDGDIGFTSHIPGFRVSGGISMDVALGDVDSDGDLDALFTETSPDPDYESRIRLFLNEGDATFVRDPVPWPPADARGAAFGDFNGDDLLDVFVAVAGPNLVAINRGDGTFEFTVLPFNDSYAVELGDLDGDGDLDAFVANGGPDRVLLNDGSGNFNASGSRHRRGSWSRDVALGDVDDDGDLDVWVASAEPFRLRLNDGAGRFDPGPPLDQAANGITLGDFDGDGALDAVEGRPAGRVFLNRPQPYWQWSHSTDDGPADSTQVVLSALMDGSLLTAIDVDVSVLNVRPTMDLRITEPSTAGEPWVLESSVYDPSAADRKAGFVVQYWIGGAHQLALSFPPQRSRDYSVRAEVPFPLCGTDFLLSYGATDKDGLSGGATRELPFCD